MRRFINDESGVTLAIAVMMVVLVGVMGAGLLTFVSRDLNSVVEVNQGQGAQDMTDAGLAAAKRHLSIVDSVPLSYDNKDTGDNSTWYDDGTGNSGQALTFDGNEVLVSIRYLNPSTDEDEAREPDNAPEVLPNYVGDPCDDVNGNGIDDDNETPDPEVPSDPPNLDACNYENNHNYFRVTVRGHTGDSIRQVEAIYLAQSFGSVPLSYYASRDIDFNGNATVMENMSIFAERNLLNVRAENITGIDHAYGDWATIPGTTDPNLYNATPRIDTPACPPSPGYSRLAAGVAAKGTITYSPINGGNVSDTKQKSKTACPQRYGNRDYDTNTDLSPILRPEFVANDWGDRANQPSTKMTYPFAPPDPAEDAQAMTVLKEKAQIQGLYFRPAPGSNFNVGSPPYPTSSNLSNTVMFVEFADGTDDSPIYGAKGHATYDARSSDADNLVKGTIVVMNGDLKISNSADDFQGAMIVRDGIIDNAADNTAINCTDNGPRMDFCSSGNVTIQGWVNVQSDIKLAGTVDGFLPSEMATGLSSLSKVTQWSYRECYNTTCS